MIENYFAVIAASLSVMSGVPYILQLPKGKIKLERGAYFLWALPPTVILIAGLAEGGRASLGIVFGDAFLGILFFALSLKYGYGGVLKRDIIGVAVASIGIIIWILTDAPIIALLASVFIDLIGAILIVMKSYEAPETEIPYAWWIYFAATIFGLMALTSYAPIFSIYPIYATVTAIAVLVALYLGRKRVKHQNASGHRHD